jgi:hypothetical protein
MPDVGIQPLSEFSTRYKLSRARRIFENAFGILAARWRVYHRVIDQRPNKVDEVIKAICVLHNYLSTSGSQYMRHDDVDRDSNGDLVPGQWREELFT